MCCNKTVDITVTYIAGSHMVAKYSSYTQTRDEGNSRLK